MSQYIPCAPAGQASWSQITSLDGVSFLLAFRWSQRQGHWILDLADADGVAIQSGMLLATGQPLLATCISESRPAGELVVLDTTGANDLDPGFADLGNPGGVGARFVLQYVTAEELAE